MIRWLLFETSSLIERELWHTYHNGTSNGPNVECLFTVTHVQSSPGALAEAAIAAWRTIPHPSKTWWTWAEGHDGCWLMKALLTDSEWHNMCRWRTVFHRSALTLGLLPFSFWWKCFNVVAGSAERVKTLRSCCRLGFFGDSIIPSLPSSHPPPSPLTYPCPEVMSHKHGGRGGRIVNSAKGTLQNGSYC